MSEHKFRTQLLESNYYNADIEAWILDCGFCEDHSSGTSLKGTRDNNLDFGAQVGFAFFNHNHCAVLKIADALGGFFARF